jgi:signal transduction histidine kinase
MHRFSFAVCDKDVQFITDLEGCLNDDFIPAIGTVKEGNMFMLSDGSAWQMEKKLMAYGNGEAYTQYIAADVSDLHKNYEELRLENRQLRKTQIELKKLSANVVIATREEEVLNTKMRVHDEMGRCLIEAQKYLRENSEDSIPESVALSWQKAVSMVKYNNDIPDEDMLSQIRKACESVGISYIQSGKLPEQKSVAYIFTCAIRECMTNAVRYAEAKDLYVNFSEAENESMITVTNSGKKPEKEIIEGGGLSTLRRRVERAGGSMHVQSKPYFELSVTIPKEREEGM